jgi:type II secretory pathway pseudopilin PulG
MRRVTSVMRRSPAFTLIEIAIAVFILLLVLLLAVPSLTGVLADRRLRRSLDTFNDLVHQAQEHSVAEHRPYLIVFAGKIVEVRPEVFVKGEEEKATAQFQIAKSDTVKLIFPAALTRNPPAEWIFWPSGICEPAVVQFVGRDGKWAATYSPLSAQPELTSYAAR